MTEFVEVVSSAQEAIFGAVEMMERVARPDLVHEQIEEAEKHASDARAILSRTSLDTNARSMVEGLESQIRSLNRVVEIWEEAHWSTRT